MLIHKQLSIYILPKSDIKKEEIFSLLLSSFCLDTNDTLNTVDTNDKLNTVDTKDTLNTVDTIAMLPLPAYMSDCGCII